MKDKGGSDKIIEMNRCYFALLMLLIGGCARHQAPAVAALPTATPVPTATPMTVAVPVMPTQVTPTPDSAEAARQAVVLRELARLRTASPDQDFATAWASGDTRFISLRGDGEYTPGLESMSKERSLALINRYGDNVIKGTTDVVEFPEQTEQSELGKLALKYATRYNQLLLQKLDEQKNIKVD